MSASRTEKEQVRVHIRWMIRRDMPEVLQTEQESFEFPWSEEDFLRCLRQRNCIGMVAEQGERVVGFMIYELHKNKLHILNFAVHPQFRRLRRRRADGREADRQALQPSPHPHHAGSPRDQPARAALLQHQGFKAVRVLRSFYEDSGEDAFLMQYCLGGEAGDEASDAVNRIAQYEES